MTYNSNFPTSLDVLANPTNLTYRDDVGFELHGVISRLQDIAEALQAKVGIGASTPGATAAVLRRNGAGASVWGPVVAGDVAGAGAGDANTVMRTTGGTTLALGKLLTADVSANAVVSGVTVGQITQSTSANIAGTAQAAGGNATMVGSSITMVCTGGPVLLIAAGTVYNDLAGGGIYLSFGIDGSGLSLEQAQCVSPTINALVPFSMVYLTVPAAASHSFQLRWRNPSGNANIANGHIAAVELKR